MSNKSEFLELYNTYIKREGAAELLSFLENKSDFFTAPASTKFHLACEGGLLAHSLSVAKLMLRYEDEPKESLVICGLLHDICKVNFYKVSTRNVKNEVTGQWEKQPFYQIEDSFPYGHGEKSVYMIERFFRLKAPEAMAIRWHMGGFDEAVRGGSFAISKAYERYPLAVKLHICDIESTYLNEMRGNAL
ncbi:MAG: HD domain-containing protein [Oscillospiraceae bacterium]|nr:HD domain-containing protein [Oscillospiraceae bacterium]